MTNNMHSSYSKSSMSRHQHTCLICLQVFSPRNGDIQNYHLQEIVQVISEEGNIEDNQGDENKCKNKSVAKDLYTKFLLFVNKYLKMTPTTRRFLSKAKQALAPLQAFCDACHQRVSQIYYLSEQLEIIKMQLSWRVGEIGEVMETSVKSVSKMLKGGLIRALTAHLLNVKHVKPVRLFRRVLQLKCQATRQKSQPRVMVNRGLAQAEWKFTPAATKEMLRRLIVVFSLASTNLASKSKQTASQKKLFNVSGHGIHQKAKAAKEGVKTEVVIENAEAVETKTIEDVGGDDNDCCSPTEQHVGDSAADSDWNGSERAESPMSMQSVDDNSSENISAGKRWNLRRNCRLVNKAEQLSDEESRTTKEEHDQDYQEDPNEDDDNDEEYKVPKKTRRVTSLQPTPEKSKKISTQKKIFKCPKCPKSFKNQGAVSMHLRYTHKEKFELSCKMCGMIFKYRKDIHVHYRVVHSVGSDVFFRPRSANTLEETKCTECFQIFPTRRTMIIHRSKVHKDTYIYRPNRTKNKQTPTEERSCWYCEACGKLFYYENRLKRHMTEEHANVYPCTVCDAKLESGKLLKDHLQTAHETEKKKYKCAICFRKFTTEQYYEIHRHVDHVDKHKFPCDDSLCNEIFDTVAELNEHLKTHLSSKEGKATRSILFCKTCKMGFLKQYSVTLHELVHTPSNKGYDCSHCDKNFSYISKLLAHYNCNHGQGSKKKCYQTDPSSPPPSPVSNLENVDDGDKRKKKRIKSRWERWDSHYEPKQNKNQRRVILELKSLKCSVDNCGEDFESAYLLRKHLENIHEKQSSEKNIQCFYCYKKFAYQLTLKLHIRVVHKSKIDVGFHCDVESCELLEHEFPTVGDLNKHLATCHEESAKEGKGVQFCSRCNWGFMTSQLHQLHELVHTEPAEDHGGDFGCPKCDKHFETVPLLQHHHNRCHGLKWKPCKCEVCGLGLFSKISLHRHMRVHSKNYIRRSQRKKVGADSEEQDPSSSSTAALVCPKCGLSFKGKKSLATHLLRFCNPDRLITCPEPGCQEKFSFTNRTSYRQHRIKSHNYVPNPKEKRSNQHTEWICDQCGKVFQSKRKLSSHVNYSHNDAKLTSCQLCEYTTRKPSAMKIHIEKNHNPDRERKHVCSQCGKSFWCGLGLQYHFDSTHKSESDWKYVCTKCPRRFYRKLFLNAHTKTCVGTKFEEEGANLLERGTDCDTAAPIKKRKENEMIEMEEERKMTARKVDMMQSTASAASSLASDAVNYTQYQQKQWPTDGYKDGGCEETQEVSQTQYFHRQTLP